MIILDLGSGNGHGNDPKYIDECISAISQADTKTHDVVLKYQLFDNEPPNVPLKKEAFEYAYQAGQDAGYKVTASVFSVDMLRYLLGFDVPFVKIANRQHLYQMAALVHDRPVMVSYPSSAEMGKRDLVKPLCCVSRYPAKVEDYEKVFPVKWLKYGISDHTVGLELWYEYMPEYYEKHFVLNRDKKNPDSGPFAITADELVELL